MMAVKEVAWILLQVQTLLKSQPAIELQTDTYHAEQSITTKISH